MNSFSTWSSGSQPRVILSSQETFEHFDNSKMSPVKTHVFQDDFAVNLLFLRKNLKTVRTLVDILGNTGPDYNLHSRNSIKVQEVLVTFLKTCV